MGSMIDVVESSRVVRTPEKKKLKEGGLATSGPKPRRR
jgi:hypothetical protein